MYISLALLCSRFVHIGKNKTSLVQHSMLAAEVKHYYRGQQCQRHSFISSSHECPAVVGHSWQTLWWHSLIHSEQFANGQSGLTLIIDELVNEVTGDWFQQVVCEISPKRSLSNWDPEIKVEVIPKTIVFISFHLCEWDHRNKLGYSVVSGHTTEVYNL